MEKLVSLVVIAVALTACGGDEPTAEPLRVSPAFSGDWEGNATVVTDPTAGSVAPSQAIVPVTTTATTDGGEMWLEVDGLCSTDTLYIHAVGDGTRLTWYGDAVCASPTATCSTGVLRFTSGAIALGDDGSLIVHVDGAHEGCGKPPTTVHIDVSAHK